MNSAGNIIFSIFLLTSVSLLIEDLQNCATDYDTYKIVQGIRLLLHQIIIVTCLLVYERSASFTFEILTACCYFTCFLLYFIFIKYSYIFGDVYDCQQFNIMFIMNEAVTIFYPLFLIGFGLQKNIS